MGINISTVEIIPQNGRNFTPTTSIWGGTSKHRSMHVHPHTSLILHALYGWLSGMIWVFHSVIFRFTCMIFFKLQMMNFGGCNGPFKVLFASLTLYFISSMEHLIKNHYWQTTLLNFIFFIVNFLIDIYDLIQTDFEEISASEHKIGEALRKRIIKKHWWWSSWGSLWCWENWSGFKHLREDNS